MSSYCGFAVTDEPTKIRTWIWGSDQEVRPRFMNSVNTYLPMPASGGSPSNIKIIYVPDTVYPGPFYMKLDDILARSGGNAADADAAKVALRRAPSAWKSDFDGWSEDGTSTRIQHEQLDPNPGSSKDYKSDKELAAMWSLIVRRVKDASARPFNIYARFWEPPKLTSRYSIYFVPTPAVTVEQLRTAVDDVLRTVYPGTTIWNAIVTSIPPPDTHKVGHNFLCLYDTYMSDQEYKRMLKSTYGDISSTSPTDPWPIRPWPSTTTAEAAQNKIHTMKVRKPSSKTTIKAGTIERRTKKALIQRPKRVMNKVDVSVVETLFWPKVSTTRKVMPPYNSEWLLRTNWALGGSQRAPNIFFGTSECGTQILRAECSIRQFALASKWDCKVVTTPSDAAQPEGTRWMWQFDTDGRTHSEAPAWVKSSSGKPYSWAIAFLDYDFLAIDKKSKQSIHVLDRFDTFNRYVPLRLEVEVDRKILDVYLSSLLHANGFNGAQHDSFISDDQTPSLPLSVSPVSGELASDSEEQATDLGMVKSYIQDPQVVAILEQTFAGLNRDTNIPIRYKCATTNLFGVGIKADIYEFDGRIPPGTRPPGGSSIYEQVELRTLSISRIIPELAGTLFDTIRVTNILFVYQNCLIDSTKGVGWSFDCDVQITQSIGALYHVSRTLFGTDTLSIHFTTNFGHSPSQTWESTLRTMSFTLTGKLSLPSSELISNVRLNSFGVHLHAVRSHTDASKPAKLRYDWDIFGDMSVSIPGTSTPLWFDYVLSENNHIVSVMGNLQGDLWRDAAGVRGLNLRGVGIGMDFSSAVKPTSLSVEITADVSINDSVLEIEGSFFGTRLGLIVTWPSFNIGELDLLYDLFNKYKLELPRIDLAVGSASLLISGGLPSLSFFDITVDGRFNIPTAELKFNLSGIEFGGSWNERLSIFDDFSVYNVEVMLSIARRGGKSYLWFKADASWTVLSQTLEFGVQVYLYKDYRGAKQYVVSGRVKGGTFWTFGNFLQGACPDFLRNIGLKSLSLLIASEDQVDQGPIVTPYQIRQGVQICAEIGKIDQVNGTLRKGEAGSANDLVLYARFPRLAIGIRLPRSLSLNFGHGVSTSPIELMVELQPDPALIIEAGIDYRPNGHGTNMEFRLRLFIQTYRAAATLRCRFDWNNPLGISRNLTITEVQLGLSMVYASGHPNSVLLGGKFKVGRNTNEVVLVFGDNPSDYLLEVSVRELDVNEIIRLTSDILGTSLPTLPNGTIYCRYFHLYACLSGVPYAGRYYPPGFSAHLDLRVFGVNANASLEIKTNSGFYGRASIQNFKFGLVYVEDAHLGISWTRRDRYVSAGGRFKVWYWWFGKKYFWVHIHINIGPGGIRLLTDPSSTLREASEMSENIKDDPSESQPDVVLEFLVLARHKLPLHMRRNIPPTDWQDPMAEGEGVIYTFEGAFTEPSLSDIAALIRRHLEALHPSTADSAYTTLSATFGSLSEEISLHAHTTPTENDIVRYYQDAYEAAENARTDRHEQLRAEFVVFRDTLDALATQYRATRDDHQNLVQSLKNEHAELLAQHEELPLWTERRRKEVEAALQEAGEELFLQENMLRGLVGDLPTELERTHSAISTIANEVHMVETALLRLSSSQLPWREAMRQRLEVTLASLRERLSSFEFTRTAIIQRQREIAESDVEPVYQALRLAKAKFAQAQEEAHNIASVCEAKADALAIAVAEAAERVRQAQTEGPIFQALTEVQQAIDNHVGSKSPHFTDQGLLIDLDQLPEAIVCEEALGKLLLALNASAERASLDKTREFWNSLAPEDRARAEDALDVLIQNFPRKPPHLESITVDGHIESGNDFEDLMLDADVIININDREIEDEFKFPVTDCHDMVNALVKKIIRRLF